jgi:hypothetical protein
MKPSIAFLLLSAFTLHAAQDGPWSKSENGLRGRLSILPSGKVDSPFCRIFVELENIEDVAEQRTIRFSPDKMTFRVTDKSGNELPKANGPYDGLSPSWTPLSLPYNGTIKFQISFPGLGYNPKRDKVIVDTGSGFSAAWVIPQDGDYFLSATLSIPKKAGGHPRIDWSGSLTFPKVIIPQAQANQGAANN